MPYYTGCLLSSFGPNRSLAVTARVSAAYRKSYGYASGIERVGIGAPAVGTLMLVPVVACACGCCKVISARKTDVLDRCHFFSPLM